MRHEKIPVLEAILCQQPSSCLLLLGIAVGLDSHMPSLAGLEFLSGNRVPFQINLSTW
jgi:hypothetical protein